MVSLSGESLVAHKAGKAARAVAALLHLAAVGVVDHVFKIDVRARRGAHAQHLIGADTKVAIGQKANLLGEGR
jgi:hypothetical protein